MKALQILFLFCTAVLYGQYAGWSSFYSFDQITAVHYGDNGQIYGVAQNSLFSYDPTANEVVPITTVNGLLGDEIDALQVTDDFMILGYSNGILGIHTLMDGSVILDNSIQRNLSIETKDNSPLPTNSIRSLAYEPQSGKTYMGTPNGLVAFQGNAYAPSENLKEVEVYPNPIRPNYTGLLTVRGLQSDCVVKITDIEGNAVFETTTTGGSIQWDLRSFSGERVRSGVYLIFVTTNDGLESAVEKVMIIN